MIANGQTATGKLVPLRVNDDGELVVSGGGGGGGDASAANQVLALTALDSIYDALQLVGTEATSADILAAVNSLGGGASLSDLATALAPLATEATQADILTALEAQGIDVASIKSGVDLLVPDLDAVRVAVEATNVKTPVLGQALAAGSVPVVLAAIQLAALTPLAAVSVSNFPATQPVSVAALPIPSGASTAANQATLISGRSPIALDGDTATAATLAAAGVLIKSGRGSAAMIEFGTGVTGAVFCQIHNRITAPSLGDRATWYAPSSTGNNQTAVLQLGHPTLGVPCSAGIWLVFSSTASTYTPIVSTAISYNIVYQ